MVNVVQQLKNMRGWLDENPTRRKTKTRILRFINAWLSKEQNQGGKFYNYSEKFDKKTQEDNHSEKDYNYNSFEESGDSIDKLNGVLDSIIDEVDINQGDYINEEGMIVCNVCKKNKQKIINILGVNKKVPCACECIISERLRIEKISKRREYENRMNYLLGGHRLIDKHYINNTFDNDDGKNPAITKGCKGYVENWEEMKKSNIGIIFSGNVGCGKSFFACCIANELIKRSVYVKVISTAKLMNLLDSAEDKQAVIDNLNNFELLVLDDLGAERNTSYALEQLFNVIDCSVNSRLPMIITTNLSFNELENPQNLEYKRIFDRIIEICPLKLGVSGNSKRVENSKNREMKAMQILKGESISVL